MKLFSLLFGTSAPRENEAAAFSPEILRLQASPPNPLPRAVLGVTAVLVAASIGWAAVGRLDIVAVAHGKLVPKSSIKIIQPAEAGIVKEILVREGEVVKEGQVLMRMDPTFVAADLAGMQTELQQKSLALRRIDAELGGSMLVRLPTDQRAMFEEVRAQYDANRGALAAHIAQERASWERSKQEVAAALATQSKLQLTLPHYREQDEAYKKLVKEGFAGKIAADDKRREFIEKEQDLHTQSFILARERANMTLSEKKIAQLESDYSRQLRAERALVAERIDKLQQEVAKQDHRSALLELRAPQAGRVKDLATHTEGTVTQHGNILMTLVPLDESLLAEVWLSNEDVGFVRADHPVKIKMAAFQFQKYGMLNGKVEQVAADAADKQDGATDSPDRQLTYRTSVILEKQSLLSDGVSLRLAPGMQVTAEVKLGDRTVLEYLLSPVRKAFHEAGRER